MEAAEYSEGGAWWHNSGIASVTRATVLAGDQVKEGGRAPTDCSRKRKEQRERRKRDTARLGHKERRKPKEVIKVQRQQIFHLANNKLRAFATNSVLPLMYAAFS